MYITLRLVFLNDIKSSVYKIIICSQVVTNEAHKGVVVKEIKGV